MILKVIDHMGFFLGALFGLSAVMASRQVFEVPFETHGWNLMAWEFSSLRFPAGIWMFVIALTLTIGWRRYKRDVDFDQAK